MLILHSIIRKLAICCWDKQPHRPHVACVCVLASVRIGLIFSLISQLLLSKTPGVGMRRSVHRTHPHRTCRRPPTGNLQLKMPIWAVSGRQVHPVACFFGSIRGGGPRHEHPAGMPRRPHDRSCTARPPWLSCSRTEVSPTKTVARMVGPRKGQNSFSQSRFAISRKGSWF